MLSEYEKILVSVIVPVYNNALFLCRCLDSILDQSYKNIEVIVIDDGSTDNSGIISDEYAKKNKKVKVIHQSNEGTVSARKRGIECATGQLVGFVDGDDWIERDMYKKLVSFYYLMNCPDYISSGIVFESLASGEKEVWLDGACERRYDRKEIIQELLPVLIFNKETYQRTILTSVCTKLIDRKIAQKVMKYMTSSISMGEDGAYVYFLTACCSSLAVMHKAFYHYEKHDNSQNYNYTGEMFPKLIQLNNVMTKGMLQLIGENEKIQEQIKFYIWNYLYNVIEQSFHIKIYRWFYQFPFAKCEKNSRVLIYGAGKVGSSYFQSLSQSEYASRIVWTDKNYQVLREKGIDVVSLSEALKEDYDHIVIALENEAMAKEIAMDLSRRGIEEKKIIYEKPIKINLRD